MVHVGHVYENFSQYVGLFSFQCEGRIADLPPALEKPECYCDPCKKKGVMTQSAKVFCTKCEHKYCAKHEEVSLLNVLPCQATSTRLNGTQR